MLVNSVVQAFFMPNAQEFSELIRTGNLDFALLKPIDTQFLISLHRVDWSALSNFVVGMLLLIFSALHHHTAHTVGSEQSDHIAILTQKSSYTCTSAQTWSRFERLLGS